MTLEQAARQVVHALDNGDQAYIQEACSTLRNALDSAPALGGHKLDRGLHLENPCDSENVLTVSATEAGVCISVSDEKAVDSYNETFECAFVMTRKDAIALRDYLNNYLAAA